jgi:PAS domain S-box-containing protein
MTDDTATTAASIALARLLAATPIGIALLDRDLRYVSVNDALGAINGRLPAEHIGRPWRELSFEAAPSIEPMLRRVLATGRPLHDVELETSLPSGAVRSLLVSYFPVREGGTVIGLGTTVVDVTARNRKHAQPGLAASAHDLRGALQTIQASTALLAKALATDTHLLAHVDVIRRCIERMRQLVDGLVPA